MRPFLLRFRISNLKIDNRLTTVICSEFRQFIL